LGDFDQCFVTLAYDFRILLDGTIGSCLFFVNLSQLVQLKDDENFEEKIKTWSQFM